MKPKDAKPQGSGNPEKVAETAFLDARTPDPAYLASVRILAKLHSTRWNENTTKRRS